MNGPVGKRVEATEKIPFEPSKKRLFLNNFLAGLAWGIGTSAGIAIGISLLVLIVSRIDLVPIIGSWLAQVFEFAITEVSKRPLPPR